MKIISISPNMSFVLDPAFGTFDMGIVAEIFQLVDINFSKTLEVSPFSSKHCRISYNHSGDFPMCCQEEEFHHIYLRCKDNYWCQWMLQFAHEYCHHLINGNLSGQISGLIWFEECICELSSMYHLHSLALHYKASPIANIQRYAISVHDYLDKRMKVEQNIASDVILPGFLSKWAPLLQEQEYHREHYRAIAARIFPLFIENPCLWKIILHFGDMRNWHTLEELFQHLSLNVTPDYSESLEKLRLLLLT